MATAKSAGAAKYGRDSNPKYLGVKLHDGEEARPGSIIIRQRGRHYIPGVNVKAGADDTLYAVATGTVKFISKRKKRFDGNQRIAKIVNVVST
ncbi:MAG: 50S ribosomal protein L27 [Candidatus Sungbacteria bacterium]|uniref:Large ribosomal subunit protein bL27 n=1 Tax=Candidatus Sungiibacteriota bacterium TaxID=2750080 RepID=A0A9D6QVE5_9BACT|nr:50S ribosomal protein L27 [Candidatus Sungbacteria bacterium]